MLFRSVCRGDGGVCVFAPAGELVSDNSFMAAVSKKKTAAMKEKLAAAQGNTDLRYQGQGLRS